MARMIPPYISSEVKSTGERQMFELFRNDPKTKDWIVLHSLCLAKHKRRLYGEIDFLLLAPQLGIFCLEVKSGNVKREDGLWKFKNRFGEVSKSTRGPFEQARDGMFSLLGAVRNKFGQNSSLGKLVYGFGVIFPHILFNIEGLEYEWWQIYDRDSRREPISNFIHRLSKYTIKKIQHSQWYNKNKSLPRKADINSLVEFFRGDFERLVTMSQQINDIEEQLDNYTAEQLKCLDQLRDNDRCLFIGAAGTGKTMIAIESARRSLSENKKVLFVCFNKLLGSWLRTQFQDDYDLTVTSFHKYLTSISEESTNTNTNNEEFFYYELPLNAMIAIDKGRIKPYDVLVIDEGQDLITYEYLDVFDASLKGGLSGGRWNIFCDFEKQAIYTEQTTEEMLGVLEKRSTFTKFRLTINCRNTKPIGEELSLVTGFEKTPYLPTKIEGIPVEYRFHKNTEEQVNYLEQILLRLLKRKIQPERITLLSPFKYDHSIVSHTNSDKFEILDLSKSPHENQGDDCLTFSTIQGFKGMENSYIILTDIIRLLDDEFNSLLYVGMSRAKVGLYLLLDSRLRENYNKLVKKGVDE